LDDLAPRIFGSAANDRGQVRGLRHDLAVIDDAKRQERQRHERHQERELGGDSAGVVPAMSPS
jgi:hypothetical protein